MRYDIFLAGVWEEYATFPYKSMIKENFPKLRIYDPEEYNDEIWFQRNYEALKESRLFFVLACDVLFPMAAVEAGIFYNMHGNGKTPSDDIVAVFPEELEAVFGEYVAERYGKVFNNIEDAINYMKYHLAYEIFEREYL